MGQISQAGKNAFNDVSSAQSSQGESQESEDVEQIARYAFKQLRFAQSLLKRKWRRRYVLGLQAKRPPSLKKNKEISVDCKLHQFAELRWDIGPSSNWVWQLCERHLVFQARPGY